MSPASCCALHVVYITSDPAESLGMILFLSNSTWPIVMALFIEQVVLNCSCPRISRGWLMYTYQLYLVVNSQEGLSSLKRDIAWRVASSCAIKFLSCGETLFTLTLASRPWIVSLHDPSSRSLHWLFASMLVSCHNKQTNPMYGYWPMVAFSRPCLAWHLENVWAILQSRRQHQVKVRRKEHAIDIEFIHKSLCVGMQLLPPILQKFIVSWSSKRTRSNDQLPWYLETQDPWQGNPDYIVCTSPLAIPACLTASTESNLSGKISYTRYIHVI